MIGRMDRAAVPVSVPVSASPRLVAPSAALLDDYLAMIDAARGRGEDGAGYNLPVTDIIRRDRAGYLRRLAEIEAGTNLPRDWVPMSTRWLVDASGALVGEVRIRHRLAPPLLIEGGHVGYFVHPAHRRKGHGRAILALALIELRERHGVTDVLVTCNADNAPSRRVIERNGGTFDRQTTSPRSGNAVRCYWIR